MRPDPASAQGAPTKFSKHLLKFLKHQRSLQSLLVVLHHRSPSVASLAGMKISCINHQKKNESFWKGFLGAGGSPGALPAARWRSPPSLFSAGPMHPMLGPNSFQTLLPKLPVLQLQNPSGCDMFMKPLTPCPGGLKNLPTWLSPTELGLSLSLLVAA